MTVQELGKKLIEILKLEVDDASNEWSRNGIIPAYWNGKVRNSPNIWIEINSTFIDFCIPHYVSVGWTLLDGTPNNSDDVEPYLEFLEHAAQYVAEEDELRTKIGDGNEDILGI